MKEIEADLASGDPARHAHAGRSIGGKVSQAERHGQMDVVEKLHALKAKYEK